MNSSADRHQSGTDGDDRVDVGGVRGPAAPGVGALSGARWCRLASRTCSTRPRGSSTPPDEELQAPNVSAAERTADLARISASPRSIWSKFGFAVAGLVGNE